MKSTVDTQMLNKLHSHQGHCNSHIQGGAEPTDTFQMVIDNIWKQGKISEIVY